MPLDAMGLLSRYYLLGSTGCMRMDYFQCALGELSSKSGKFDKPLRRDSQGMRDFLVVRF